MPLQDLTPQLRTRLNPMERVVGWFILAATTLMILALGYYLYRTAEQRGWFEVKAVYKTYADTGDGLTVGDEVRLMGFPVGRITEIKAMPPRGKGSEHNVQIMFMVVGTNYNYIWTGNSRARFVSSGFIGKKELDITKGTNGYNTYINFPVQQMTLAEIKSSPDLAALRLGEEVFKGTNLEGKAWLALSNNAVRDKLAGLGLSNVWTINIITRRKGIKAVWNEEGNHYEPFFGTNIYTLPPDESPGLMDRVDGIVGQVEAALPNFLALTNQIAATLSNSMQLTSNLNAVAAGIRPAVSDVAAITANLRDPHGSLGEWLIPTNLNQELALTLLNANGAITNANLALTNVNGTLATVNTNLAAMFAGVGSTLDNVADLTSNLNHQVQVNSNMLSEISKIIVDTDNFVQGLKHHWLLRSAFKPAKTNAPANAHPSPSLRK
ncbi:MAG: MlaD family protein [Verrucomicrobiota bacterium]